MAVFYHVDRTSEALTPGLVMGWMPIPSDLAAEERMMLARWFPRGVTRFGLDIILKRSPRLAFERQLETLRRERYPDLPSRLASVFALKSIADIHLYRHQMCLPSYSGRRGRIWKVEGRAVFCADINLERQHCGDLEAAAALYWAGETSDDPLFEYLLEPPVTVVEEVPETESPD
jgi:hypothetical protein